MFALSQRASNYATMATNVLNEQTSIPVEVNCRKRLSNSQVSLSLDNVGVEEFCLKLIFDVTVANP